MKLYFVPQLPIRGRYQEWWPQIWEEEIKKFGIDFEIILPNKNIVEKTNYFTDEESAVEWELEQVKYLYKNAEKGDKILFADLDYPSFVIPLAFFLAKRGVEIYGIIHGAFFNKGDIWFGSERKNFMRAEIDVCKKVFVATESFKNDLSKNLGVGKTKIKVFGLPFYYENFTPNFKKENLIFVKGNLWRQFIEELKKFGEVVLEKDLQSREEYLNVLKKAKVAIIWKDVETFGYSFLECLANSCLTIVKKLPCYLEYEKYCYEQKGIDDLLFTPIENALSIPSHLEMFMNMSEEEISRRYSNTLPLLKKFEKSASMILREVLR
ncbi:MAG: hypothetical protein QXG39_00370 [Candidatus Aenigmatarchaeota archaeon]